MTYPPIKKFGSAGWNLNLSVPGTAVSAPDPGVTVTAARKWLGGVPAIQGGTVSRTSPISYKGIDFGNIPDPVWKSRSEKWEDGLSKAAGMAEKIAPFATNIANALRKPPMPRKGTPNPYVTLRKVNLQEERNAVERATNAANRSADRNVTGNTAEAIKAFNRGTNFERLSSVNDRENQMNVGIQNQQALLDQQVTMGNNAKVDEYNQSLVERDIAHQREQSANLANAGDKYTLMRNEREKGRVELEKAKVLQGLYEKSGVLKRDNAIGRQWKASGIVDPFGEDYKWLEESKAYGGLLTRVPGRKLK